MQIQVNTDNNVDGTEGLAAHIEAEVAAALSRFGERVTRVEVHLGDESAGRSSELDQRCMIEARVAGHQPVSVVEHASTMDESVRGAIHKLVGLLTNTIDRLDDRNDRDTIRGHADH